MSNTRTVSLWVHNDPNLYRISLDLVRNLDKYDAGNALRNFYVEYLPADVEGLYLDLLSHALEDVDWSSIAEELLDA